MFKVHTKKRPEKYHDVDLTSLLFTLGIKQRHVLLTLNIYWSVELLRLLFHIYSKFHFYLKSPYFPPFKKQDIMWKYVYHVEERSKHALILKVTNAVRWVQSRKKLLGQGKETKQK